MGPIPATLATTGPAFRWAAVVSSVLCLASIAVAAYLTYAHYRTAQVLACSDKGLVCCAKVTTYSQIQRARLRPRATSWPRPGCAVPGSRGQTIDACAGCDSSELAQLSQWSSGWSPRNCSARRRLPLLHGRPYRNRGGLCRRGARSGRTGPTIAEETDHSDLAGTIDGLSKTSIRQPSNAWHLDSSRP
jgi:hypothetical protein